MDTQAKANAMAALVDLRDILGYTIGVPKSPNRKRNKQKWHKKQKQLARRKGR